MKTPHDHHHDCEDHDHGPHEAGGGEQPFDAANQSLSDALKASFRILKGIMLVLVVLYLFSNVHAVGPHEQAMVLRFGKLQDKVHEAGLVPALPLPIDQVLALPTRKSNEILIESHSFHREEGEIGKPLAMVDRGHDEGLNPSLDGALLTADSGIVHVQWKVTYKIDNVKNFIQSMAGGQATVADAIAPAEKLIRTLIETVGIHVASEVTAEEVIRTNLDQVRGEIKRQVNLRLAELDSGIVLTLVEMFEPTAPMQIRGAFDETQRAENAKQRRIRDAEQERIKILSEAAGGMYPRLVQVLDRIDEGGSPDRAADELTSELDEILQREVEGKAGKMIKDAGAYYAVVVGEIQSDLKLYETLIPEYQRNPELLFGRLWEQTRQELFSSRSLTKIYRAPGIGQVRVKIGLDPDQSRLEEEERLRRKDFDPSKLRPEHWKPVGPEFD